MADGLRREQSATRRDLEVSAWDDNYGLQKFNPMLEWTSEQVWAYIHDHAVPYNRLHDRGYTSIGCAPCTRAVGPGEDPRAGRWWWEMDAVKECGLHLDPATGQTPTGKHRHGQRQRAVVLDRNRTIWTRRTRNARRGRA